MFILTFFNVLISIEKIMLQDVAEEGGWVSPTHPGALNTNSQ